jgi:hypothetical protein
VWACRLGIAILPLLLALGFYYRPFLLEGKALPTGSDKDFYIYQTARMADLNGRWWELGRDELLGQPYPSSMARFPQLYEGVELLLISSLSARVLSPVVNYHALNLLMLALNGWVAAWFVLRLTKSYGWAALSVVLITLNMCVDLRVSGHLHLLGYCWMLLSVWSFLRYLDAPTLGRGAILGLTFVLVLASSFYWGFFLLLTFGAWLMICLVAGSLRRQHLLPAVVCGVVMASLAMILTIPVWTHTSRYESYITRNPQEIWSYSSEIWQYFVSRYWPKADYFLRPERTRPWSAHEGWNYPGLVVWIGIACYLVARLRGWKLADDRTRIINRLLGISAILVVISLWGGPALVIYKLVPSFRCYGRAGMMAVGLWCVVVPVILCWLVERLRRPFLRTGLLVLALAVALAEGEFQFGHGGRLYATPRPEPDAPWIGWLAQQPSDVRVLILPVDYQPAADISRPDTFYFAYARALHKHAVLNGCDREALESSLRSCGCTTHAPNMEGLRHLVALGYNTLVIQREYLEANGWLRVVSGLEFDQVLGDWYIYRVKSLPEPPVAKAGTHIDCAETSSLAYLGSGWLGLEDGLQWSGKVVTLNFRLDEIQPLQLRIMAKTVGPQRITVTVNGKEVASRLCRGEDLEPIVCDLPQTGLAERNTLVLTFPDARRRPVSEKSKDDRDFGAGVKCVEFTLPAPKN